MSGKPVGIIANPASGKDIRRIVTYSSAYDNQEKVNIIRRVIMALHATGVRQIHYMPEYYNIVPRAVAGMYGAHEAIVSEMTFTPLDFMYSEKEKDSIVAGAMMRDLDVGCIITLGGDGTNRAVAKNCGKVPLIPVSTGTNNVFPSMVEGTTAGLAAGVVAMGACDGASEVLQQRKRLELYVDGAFTDIALIDLVVLQENHVGARAMWDASNIDQMFVTQCAPHYIGISSIAGQLETISPTEPRGMALTLDNQRPNVRAAIAPGIISGVGVTQRTVMNIGDEAPIHQTPCMIAVDGERSLQIRRGKTATVRLSADGPVVVDIQKALSTAAKAKYFILED